MTRFLLFHQAQDTTVDLEGWEIDVLRFASVALLALFAFLVTGPAYAQQGSRRVGIGVAIGNPYDILPQLEAETLAAPTILIPIQVTDGFRLEPEIGIFRSRNEELGPSSRNDEAIVDTVNGVEVGVGLFPQKLQQNFRLYYGVRVGYMRIAEEGPFFGDTRTVTLNGFFVAPAVGGEFLFSNRFSLGAEVQFRHTSVTRETVAQGLISSDGSPASEKTERSASATRVLLISRFYF